MSIRNKKWRVQLSELRREPWGLGTRFPIWDAEGEASRAWGLQTTCIRPDPELAPCGPLPAPGSRTPVPAPQCPLPRARSPEGLVLMPLCDLGHILKLVSFLPGQPFGRQTRGPPAGSWVSIPAWSPPSCRVFQDGDRSGTSSL